LLKIDTAGNSDNYRELISERKVQNSISSSTFQVSQQQTCHECAKLDLRTKVETNLAYNEYKQMIRARTHEKYTVIVLIVFIIILIWFRNGITISIGNVINGSANSCSGVISNHQTRKNCLNKFLN
jgi:hypothetical protein